MKPERTFLLASFMLCLNTIQSNGQGLYFYLANNTGKTFDKIYVSPSEQGRWGNNLIPTTYLNDGYKTRIDLSENYGRTCYFDLQINTTDGRWYTFSTLNLCDLYSVTVNWDWTYQLVWEWI